MTEAVVRSAWAAAQEWTGAWKVGSGHLRTVVDGLEGLGGDGVPEKGVHDAANSVHAALVKMVSCGGGDNCTSGWILWNFTYFHLITM